MGAGFFGSLADIEALERTRYEEQRLRAALGAIAVETVFRFS
jgi:hypothetical protein